MGIEGGNFYGFGLVISRIPWKSGNSKVWEFTISGNGNCNFTKIWKEHISGNSRKMKTGRNEWSPKTSLFRLARDYGCVFGISAQNHAQSTGHIGFSWLFRRKFEIRPETCKNRPEHAWLASRGCGVAFFGISAQSHAQSIGQIANPTNITQIWLLAETSGH